MTVEADPVRVESRLAAGQVDCPCCPGALRPWGWARPRGVHGIDGVRRGLPKTTLEHVYSAVALNLIRLDAYWNGNPLDRTRSSHLTRLELALAA